MRTPRTLTVFVLTVLTTLVASAESKDDERARVFVPESESWSLGGEFDILEGDGGVTGGAKPQTAEIVESCPSTARKERRQTLIFPILLWNVDN